MKKVAHIKRRIVEEQFHYDQFGTYGSLESKLLDAYCIAPTWLRKILFVLLLFV